MSGSIDIRRLDVFLFAVSITIEGISGFEDGKSVRYSAYKRPTGDFLLPQPANDNVLRDHHGTPTHFEELRSIHKIKDRYKRETVLEGRIRRPPRSPLPQLFGGVALGVTDGQEKEIKVGGSARAEKSAAISGPTLSAGLKFDAPLFEPGVGKIGSTFEGGGGGKLEAEVPLVKTGVDIGLGTAGLNVGLKADGEVPQVQANVGIEVPSGKLQFDEESILPIVDANIRAPVSLPNINTGVDVNAEVGAGVTLPTISVGANSGAVGGGLNFGGKEFADLSIGAPTSEFSLRGEPGGAVSIPTVNVGNDVNGKLDVGLTLPSTNVKTSGDLNLGGKVVGDSNFPLSDSGFSFGASRENVSEANLNVPLVSFAPNGTITVKVPNAKLEELITAQEKLLELLGGEQRTTNERTLPMSTTPVAEEDGDNVDKKRNESEKNKKVENTTTKNESEVVDMETTQSPTESTTTTPVPLTSNENIEVKNGELLLPPNYEILEIPKPNYGKSIGLDIQKPLECFLFIRLLGLSRIDEIQGSITFDADFTIQWIDGLIFDVSEAWTQPLPTKDQLLKEQYTLSPSFLKKIWRPDLYLDDLIRVEQPTIAKDVVSLKFNKRSGLISYTVRMTATVNCPMSFEYYPADTQRCVLRMASYSHRKEDMSLNWLVLDDKNTGVVIDDDSDDNFDINIEDIDKYEYMPKWNNPANASYEVLTFSLASRRKMSYHLMQTYLPSLFNILVTWLVFLIPYSLYDCRIGTTMTTLLTLTAMFSGVREASPQVNYVKAIDLWMLACLAFIFLNLVELTLMTWMRVTIESFEESEQKMEDQEAGSLRKKNEDGQKAPWKINTCRKIYNYLSHYAFPMFAGLFLLFNIVYWTWLFTASQYFNWQSHEEKEL